MTKEEFSRRFTEAIVMTALRVRQLPFERDPNIYAAAVTESFWREFVSHGGTPERMPAKTRIIGVTEHSMRGWVPRDPDAA